MKAGIKLGFAFPKMAKGICQKTESPSAGEPKQLRDLFIDMKVKKPEAARSPSIYQSAANYLY